MDKTCERTVVCSRLQSAQVVPALGFFLNPKLEGSRDSFTAMPNKKWEANVATKHQSNLSVFVRNSYAGLAVLTRPTVHRKTMPTWFSKQKYLWVPSTPGDHPIAMTYCDVQLTILPLMLTQGPIENKQRVLWSSNLPLWIRSFYPSIQSIPEGNQMSSSIR